MSPGAAERCVRGLALVAMLGASASLAAPANLVDTGAEVPTILEAKPPPRFAASTTAAAHRITLPSSPVLHVRLSVFEGLIEILTPSGAPLRARLELNDTPCRPVNPLSDELVLHCTTERIDAAIVTAKGHQYLDLRELRGIPTSDGDDGPPLLSYPPEQIGLGSACPGDTIAALAECAYEAKQYVKAQALLVLGLNHEQTVRYSALRLGDIAMRHRDPNKALEYFSMAGDEGPWGRVATERICELTGLCYRNPNSQVFDPIGLPDILRAEMLMRQVRTYALLGRWGAAMDQLANMLDTSPTVCMGDATMLCRRMVLAALRTPNCPRETSLSTYLRLPQFLKGPLAAEMARAAGEDAGELGAPEYGATLLSSTARLASRSELLTHARETIALYLAASDPVRAHVMWSWASTHLTPAEVRQLPPDSPVNAPAASRTQLLGADLETDESNSALVIAHSMLLRSRITAPPGRSSRSKR